MSPENVVAAFFHKTDPNLWKIFIFTVCAGVILYFKMLTTWLTNPDGVSMGLVVRNSFLWEDSLGRIGLQVPGRLRGGYVFPAFQTILSIFMVAFIAILLYKLFEMKHVLWGVLIGALLICSPSLCSTLSYYYTSDSYMLAFLCSVLFVYLLAKHKGLFPWICAALLLTVSLSLYQAYLGTAVTLSVLYLLFLLLCRTPSFREILVKGGQLLSAGIAGTVFYLIVYKVYCHFTGIVASPYRGFDNMGHLPLRDLGKLFMEACKGFYHYFLTDRLYNNSWFFRGKVNLLFLLLLFALIICTIIYRQLYLDIKKLALILLLSALLPLAFMSIMIIAPEASIYEVTGILMLPHMNFLFIFTLVLAASYEGKTPHLKDIFQWLSLFVCGAAVYILIIYTQIFQNCMEMSLNTTYGLACRMEERLEELPEYQPDMGIMIGGRPENGNYPLIYPEMYAVVKGTAAPYGYMWDDINGQQKCWKRFFKQFLGVNYNVCPLSDAEEILGSAEYQNMPIFPSEGSVKIMGEYAVIKFSY